MKLVGFKAVMILLAVAFLWGTGFAATSSRTYTLDSDFDEGVLVGVEHETVHDQLQLSSIVVTLPFIWVPNYDGSVSKVSTDTGKELGRYRIAPTDKELPYGGNPSRTTVDLKGNCWVGNRQAGTVVKIGLYEVGECKDRNGNGTIETSQDLNNDGDITDSEMLPWSQDECVLYEVVLVSGEEGTYIPGTYTGSYDTDYWGVAPRGIAVDSSNNVWVGTWSTSKYYHINGETGAIMYTLDVFPWGHSSYGAVIDKNGILWSAQLGSNVLRINTSDITDIMRIDVSNTYGIGLDNLGHLFVGGGGYLTKIDTSDILDPIMWSKSALAVRGVATTSDNDVWVAGYDQAGGWNYNSVSRYDNDGNWKATISSFNCPSGVAVDHNGKVWVCNICDEWIHRIDPATNTVDLSKQIVGSGGHYTYSDMTGYVSRTITTKTGTWTVDFDTEASDSKWGIVSWNSSEPEGTSVKVQVRSSNDGLAWSDWEVAGNGVPLVSTPDGRYLQIMTTLQISQGEVSPILYDLTAKIGCTDADGDGYAVEGGSCGPIDCNDSDPLINPGATEICNGIDDDCDGTVDEGFDADGDGVADCFDNCPNASNPDQLDSDGDGKGDVCDTCPFDTQNDADNDGVCGDVDRCASTVIPEQKVPTVKLGVNRFALINSDGIFDTVSPTGNGPRKTFTINDTKGCSCSQILSMRIDNMEGHWKYGCSISVMEEWISSIR